MPKLTKRLTDSVARALPAPERSYQIYWCRDTEGFGVRVTAGGARAWIMERRVNGETKRRTLGAADGRGAISSDAARKLMITRSSELQQGTDQVEIRRAEAKQERLNVTLAEAVRQYTEGKRRGKDGLPLKARTKADYLAMVEAGGTTKDGKPRADGELYPLATRTITRFSGEDMRKLYEQLQKRGQRRATYAMQVLRAVLNWHGVAVPGNPLGKDVPGRDRIVLPPTVGKPNPIPPERLGAWWRAACAAGRDGAPGRVDSADYVRFVLLTGVRSGESAGSEYVDGILVRDLDIVGGRVTLPDTKNRRDHTLYLSRQALEIAKAHAKGKRAGARLFSTRDPGKTLDAICAAAGVPRRGLHDVRKTFASIAEELVSGYTLKRMLNHSDTGDVTGAHYIGKGEAQLRAGWQAVADFVDEVSKRHPKDVQDLI